MSFLLDILVAYIMSNSIPLFIAIRLLRYYRVDDVLIDYITKVIRHKRGYVA